jgi:hypothetical protein
LVDPQDILFSIVDGTGKMGSQITNALGQNVAAQGQCILNAYQRFVQVLTSHFIPRANDQFETENLKMTKPNKD